MNVQLHAIPAIKTRAQTQIYFKRQMQTWRRSKRKDFFFAFLLTRELCPADPQPWIPWSMYIPYSAYCLDNTIHISPISQTSYGPYGPHRSTYQRVWIIRSIDRSTNSGTLRNHIDSAVSYGSSVVSYGPSVVSYAVNQLQTSES